MEAIKIGDKFKISFWDFSGSQTVSVIENRVSEKEIVLDNGAKCGLLYLSYSDFAKRLVSAKGGK